MTTHTALFAAAVILTIVHFSTGATIGFTEEDYRGREESTTIRLVVSKQGQNTNEIVVSVIPMTFGQFEASGKNLPLDFQPTDLPDPAEFEANGRQDFNADIQTVRFEASTHTIDVEVFINITNDIINEAEEGFFAVLRTEGTPEDFLGLDISRGVSLCVIVDNDRVRISFEQQLYSVFENIGNGSNNLVHLVKENQLPSELNLNVLVTLTQRTADRGSDFQIESALQSYTFYPGEDNVTIPLTILNDQIPEASENLLLSLSIPPGPNVGTYQIGTNPSTVVNINDDDIVHVGFEKTEYTVKEGDGFVDVVVKLLEPGEIDLITYAIIAVTPGSATEDKDYIGIDFLSKYIKIPTSDTNEYEVTIRIEIVDDDESETTEEFVIELYPDGGYTLPNVALSVNRTVIIIQDDDVIFVPELPTDCQDACDENALCVDVSGVLQCVCNPGYTGNGVVCTDIDECALGIDTCDDTMRCFVLDDQMVCVTYADCTNSPGSYTCSCRQGFEGDGITCEDINECRRDLDDCSVNAWCTNLPSTYDCNCKKGYKGDGKICIADIPEPLQEPEMEEEPEEEVDDVEEEDECTPHTHSHSRSSTSRSPHTHSHSRSSTSRSRTTNTSPRKGKRSKTGTHTSRRRTSTSHGTRKCGTGTRTDTSQHTTHSTRSTRHSTRSTRHTTRSTRHSTRSTRHTTRSTRHGKQ